VLFVSSFTKTAGALANSHDQFPLSEPPNRLCHGGRGGRHCHEHPIPSSPKYPTHHISSSPPPSRVKRNCQSASLPQYGVHATTAWRDFSGTFGAAVRQGSLVKYLQVTRRVYVWIGVRLVGLVAQARRAYSTQFKGREVSGHVKRVTYTVYVQEMGTKLHQHPPSISLQSRTRPLDRIRALALLRSSPPWRFPYCPVHRISWEWPW